MSMLKASLISYYLSTQEGAIDLISSMTTPLKARIENRSLLLSVFSEDKTPLIFMGDGDFVDVEIVHTATFSLLKRDTIFLEIDLLQRNLVDILLSKLEMLLFRGLSLQDKTLIKLESKKQMLGVSHILISRETFVPWRFPKWVKLRTTVDSAQFAKGIVATCKGVPVVLAEQIPLDEAVFMFPNATLQRTPFEIQSELIRFDPVISNTIEYRITGTTTLSGGWPETRRYHL